MDTRPACPLCRGSRTRPRYRHGEYTIFACRSCRGGFAWPRLGRSGLGGVYNATYAETYAAGVMQSQEFARRRFEQLQHAFGRYAPTFMDPIRVRVLDIGCASGGLLAEFSRRGWRAEGVEYSETLAALARSSGLEVHVGDFLALDLPPHAYDLVTMFHVIEHFDDPSAAVAKCHSLLRDGGMLVMETPNWRGIGALVRRSRWSHIMPPEHLNYFGPAALSGLARRGGFATARARTITPQVIEALAKASRFVTGAAGTAYSLASLVGVGTTLQVFATKGARALQPGRERYE